MPRTSIKVSNVISASSKGTTAKNRVGGVETGIGSTRGAIDWKILSRNNINYRLNNVKNSVGQIENDIAAICAAINNGALKYQQTENTVLSYASELGNVYSKGTATSSSGKFDALFADVSLDDWKLKAFAGVLNYTKGDTKFTFLGAEYENDLLHLYDNEELTAFLAKLETGKSEQYLGKITANEEYSNKASYEFDTDKPEKWLNDKFKADDDMQEDVKKEEKGYYDLDGKKIDEKDAPTFYDREVTIMEIDKTVGVSASFYEGTFSTGGEGSEVNITVGKAEAHASISGGFYVIGDDGEKKFSPGVKAEVGTSVTAFEVSWDQQWLGDKNLGLNTNVTATAGKAEAKADVTAQIFSADGSLDLQLGASASAELIGGEIEGSVGVNVLGGEIGVTGGINYGIGAHADVGFRDGVLKVDVGASLGIGLSLDVEVDIGGMVDTAVDAIGDGIEAIADTAEAVWDNVEEGWNDFWSFKWL